MFEIFTCDCKISELEEKGIHISCTGNSFDCVCDAEDEVFRCFFEQSRSKRVKSLHCLIKRIPTCMFLIANVVNLDNFNFVKTVVR